MCVCMYFLFSYIYARFQSYFTIFCKQFLKIWKLHISSGARAGPKWWLQLQLLQNTLAPAPKRGCWDICKTKHSCCGPVENIVKYLKNIIFYWWDLKWQSNEIFDLQFFYNSNQPAWATDQWGKLVSSLIKISRSYSTYRFEKLTPRGIL